MKYLLGPLGSKKARKDMRSGPADINELYSTTAELSYNPSGQQMRSPAIQRLRSMSSLSAVDSIAGTSTTSAGTSYRAFSFDSDRVNDFTNTANTTGGPNTPESTLLVSQLYASAVGGDFDTFQRVEAELENRNISIPFQQLTTSAIHQSQTDSTVLSHCLQQGASLDDPSTVQALENLGNLQQPPPRAILDVLDEYNWRGPEGGRGDNANNVPTQMHSSTQMALDETRLLRAFRQNPWELLWLIDHRGARVSHDFLQNEALQASTFRPACVTAVIARQGIATFEGTGIGHRAAELGKIDVVRVLLEAGANPNEVFGPTEQLSDLLSETNSPITPPPSTMLLGAVRYGDFDLITLLLDHGASPQDGEQYSEIFGTAISGGNDRILTLLQARIGEAIPRAAAWS